MSSLFSLQSYNKKLEYASFYVKNLSFDGKYKAELFFLMLNAWRS